MSGVTPQQMRELAGVLDRCADNDRNAVRVPLLHESADVLRTAADQLEAVQATLAAIHAVEWVELPIETDSWARWGGQIDAILNADAT